MRLLLLPLPVLLLNAQLGGALRWHNIFSGDDWEEVHPIAGVRSPEQYGGGLNGPEENIRILLANLRDEQASTPFPTPTNIIPIFSESSVGVTVTTASTQSVSLTNIIPTFAAPTVTVTASGSVISIASAGTHHIIPGFSSPTGVRRYIARASQDRGQSERDQSAEQQPPVEDTMVAVKYGQGRSIPLVPAVTVKLSSEAIEVPEALLTHLSQLMMMAKRMTGTGGLAEQQQQLVVRCNQIYEDIQFETAEGQVYELSPDNYIMTSKENGSSSLCFTRFLSRLGKSTSEANSGDQLHMQGWKESEAH